METTQTATYPFSDREPPSIQPLSAESAYRAQCQLGSIEIEVKVPNLKKLADKPAAGTDYRLTGGTDKHHGPTAFPSEDNNHYGTEKATNIIDEVGKEYKNLKSGATLGINDMSLPNGGLFDKNGNWKKPHSKHRVGKSVDIDRKHQTSSGAFEFNDTPVIEDLFTDPARGAWRINEPGGLLHFEMPD